MSFKFLGTINSRCTTVELAISVDGLLKNVLAQHLPGTLYIFCGNIYTRFEILQYTIIYENTSRNHFLNQMENMSRDKVEYYYLLTAAFLMSVCHRVVLTYGMPHGIHTKRTPVAASR
jgi:hypothetical protein